MSARATAALPGIADVPGGGHGSAAMAAGALDAWPPGWSTARAAEVKRPRHPRPFLFLVLAIVGLAVVADAAPTPLPPDVDVPNAMRGILAPLGHFPPRARQAWTLLTWAELEPERDRYDFSRLEDALEQARQGGAQLAFGIACVNAGRSVSGVDVPPYLTEILPRGFRFDDRVADARAPVQGHLVYVPDWNDPAFLERARRLIAALGARYDGDPRLAWMELGFYGNRGDWSVRGFPYPARTGAEPATPATLRALLRMQTQAFPRTRQIMPDGGLAPGASPGREAPRRASGALPSGKAPRRASGALPGDRPALASALALSTTVGIRLPGLGRPGFAWALTAAAALDRWKTAPVVASVGALNAVSRSLARHQIWQFHVAMVAGDAHAARALAPAAGYRFAIGRLDVPFLRVGGAFIIHERWINAGVTPAYGPWQVLFELRRAGDKAGAPPAWIGHSRLELRGFLPGPRTLRERFRLPETMRPGRYRLFVLVADPAGYRAPLALAQRGRQMDGSYGLGEERVTR